MIQGITFPPVCTFLFVSLPLWMVATFRDVSLAAAVGYRFRHGISPKVKPKHLERPLVAGW